MIIEHPNGKVYGDSVKAIYDSTIRLLNKGVRSNMDDVYYADAFDVVVEEYPAYKKTPRSRKIIPKCYTISVWKRGDEHGIMNMKFAWIAYDIADAPPIEENVAR